MRHAPTYPPPPRQTYPFNMPPQPIQAPRTEQTPPRPTSSFNNDESPSGIAVNTLLMAAYAMTELDGKKKSEEDGANKAALKEESTSTGEKTDKLSQPTESSEVPAIHGFGSAPSKEAAQISEGIEDGVNKEQ